MFLLFLVRLKTVFWLWLENKVVFYSIILIAQEN